MTVRVFHARLFHSFREHGNFFQIFSQGSMATYARYGGIFNNHFIANFLQNLLVITFKSRLQFDRITAMSLVSPFLLGYSVYSDHILHSTGQWSLSSSRGLLRFQLMTMITHYTTVLCIINGIPLMPVEDSKEAEEVNKAVGGDEHSMQVWQTRWRCYQQRETRQNHHTDN